MEIYLYIYQTSKSVTKKSDSNFTLKTRLSGRKWVPHIKCLIRFSVLDFYQFCHLNVSVSIPLHTDTVASGVL